MWVWGVEDGHVEVAVGLGAQWFSDCALTGREECQVPSRQSHQQHHAILTASEAQAEQQQGWSEREREREREREMSV